MAGREGAARGAGARARLPRVTVVTVGDSGVGKTALVHRACHDTFPQVRAQHNTTQTV